jgi:hypothetical protein
MSKCYVNNEFLAAQVEGPGIDDSSLGRDDGTLLRYIFFGRSKTGGYHHRQRMYQPLWA